MIGTRPERSAQTPQNGTSGSPKRKKAAFRKPVQAGISARVTATVPRYRGRKRKTWDTVAASIVEAIPNSTSSPIHPVAIRGGAATVVSVDMSADFKRPPKDSIISVLPPLRTMAQEQRVAGNPGRPGGGRRFLA